jgi:hypothetical protein
MRRNGAIALAAGLVMAGSAWVADASSDATAPAGAAPPAVDSAHGPAPMPEVRPRRPGPVPMPEVRPTTPGPVPMPEIVSPRDLVPAPLGSPRRGR